MSNHRNEPKPVVETKTVDIGPYKTMTATFTAYRYPGEPRLLDTRVDLNIQDFAISWGDKAVFLAALQDLIVKFQI